MNAVDLLLSHHRRLEALLEELADAKGEEERARLFGQAADHLTMHITIEEEIFYPEVKEASEEIKDVVDEGVEEHHVADTLMSEVKTLTAEDDAFAAKMKVLIESVEHHAEEEEQEMFPPVRKAFDKATLEELGVRLEARKAELGAPTMADKEHLTTEELKELAKEQEIPGRSSMDREELVATVAPE